MGCHPPAHAVCTEPMADTGCFFPVDRIRGPGNDRLRPVIVTPSDPEMGSVLCVLAYQVPLNLGLCFQLENACTRDPNVDSTDLK